MSAEYNEIGPIFVTWGKKKQATWRFVDAFADECFMAIDDINGLAAPVADALSAALGSI